MKLYPVLSFIARCNAIHILLAETDLLNFFHNFDQVHAYIIAYLHDNMPTLFKKDKAKAKMNSELDRIYKELAIKHNISLGKLI